MSIRYRRHLGRSLGRVCALFWALAPALAQAETTAFFYSAPVPRELFEVYDQVVVQPDQAPNPGNFSAAKGQPVAYVSVGEVLATGPAAAQIRPEWVIARNAGWATWVLDPRSAGVQDYLLSRIEELWSQGYRRFFLDTLDSYRLGLRADAAVRQAEAGWVKLIRAIRARHPESKLLLNRGFELLPEVAPLVSGVVAESLFDGYDARSQSYVRVPEDSRRWLLGQLQTARDRYGLPVTVIDYRPRSEREAARATAQRIAELGFEPWVADGLLSSLGVAQLEVLPRNILILTDDPAAAEGKPSGALDLLGPVIEYLGYVPVQHALAQGLPGGNLSARYAGLVTWFGSAAAQGYGAWLLGQVRSGLRVAILGDTGFAADGAEAQELGLRVVQHASAEPTQVVQRDALVGFEADPPAHPFEGPILSSIGPSARSHLTLADASGHQGTAIGTCAWGGLATSHVLALSGLAGERSWVLDPFAFLSLALALPPVPEPDLSSENGRRIALVVVRAAGLSWPARLPGSPPTVRALSERILGRYPWPHGLDVGVAGPGPLPSEQDLAAARQLLASPLVYEARGLLPGSADLRRGRASLTRLRSLAWRSDLLLGPIGSDLSYLPPNAREAYPFARVRETLEYTERPRRLAPILLDYHAFLAASAGGLATLEALYRWLAAGEPYWLDLDAYRARLAAFREQVVARHLDGSISYHGGEALRTLRVPYDLGTPDLRASSGVAVLRQVEQAQYSSFGPGAERRIVLARSPAAWPHLTQTNGRVRSLHADVDDTTRRLDFELESNVALQIGFGGLGAAAHCRLELGAEGASARGQPAPVFVGVADPEGRWQISLTGRATGPSHLSCALPREPA
jgi:hypothetical protein